MIEPNVPDEQHPKRMSKANSASTRSLKTKVGTRAMVANNSPRNDAFRHQQVLAAYYNIARQLADRIDSCEHKPSCWSRNEPVGV